METPSELFVSGLPLPSRVYNTWCQHRPRSLAPRSRAAHTVASWTPERCALVLHRHIVPQLPPVASVRGNNPCPAAALPPRLCEAPPGTVNHPPARVSSSRPPPTHTDGRTRTPILPRQRSRTDTSHHRAEAAVEGSPTAGLRPPIGLCIRGVRGYASAAGGQAVHAAMAQHSATFACLQPIFHVTQAEDGATSRVVLVGHQAFQDVSILVRILRELRCGQGRRLATAIGDIHACDGSGHGDRERGGEAPRGGA